MLMDGPGNDALAGTAFADDEYGDVEGGDAADLLAHLVNRRCFADDVPWPRLASNGIEPRVSRFEGALQNAARPLAVERFAEIFERPVLHGFDGRIGGSVSGGEYNR